MHSRSRLRGPFAATTVCAALLIIAGDAGAITVPNFSFESPSAGDNGVATPNDWVVSGAGGVYDPLDDSYPGATGNTTPLPAPGDGFQVAWTNTASPGDLRTITSLLPVVTVAANTQYTLTVALGDRATADLYPGILNIDLLVNGVQEATTLSGGNAIDNGTFVDVTTSFTTAAVGDARVGGALTIRLRHTYSGSGVTEQANFDNVRLEAVVVPEPAGLFALSGGTLLLRRRRR